jgi:hypothetical protein
MSATESTGGSSTSDGGSSSSSLSSQESGGREQAVPRAVTGATADPEVLQHFWALASLEQVRRRGRRPSVAAAYPTHIPVT